MPTPPVPVSPGSCAVPHPIASIPTRVISALRIAAMEPFISPPESRVSLLDLSGSRAHQAPCSKEPLSSAFSLDDDDDDDDDNDDDDDDAEDGLGLHLNCREKSFAATSTTWEKRVLSASQGVLSG